MDYSWISFHASFASGWSHCRTHQYTELGRMALVVEIEAGGATLVTYNVHLERRDSESLRLLQLEEIVADAKRYQPGTPLILAGDFNTSSHDSPVIKRLGEAGFRNALEKGNRGH